MPDFSVPASHVYVHVPGLAMDFVSVSGSPQSSVVSTSSYMLAHSTSPAESEPYLFDQVLSLSCLSWMKTFADEVSVTSDWTAGTEALSVAPGASANCGETCATGATAEVDSSFALLSACCCACSVSCCREAGCWLEAASPFWATCSLAAPLTASLAAASVAALPGCCASESACSACAPAAAWASAKAVEGVMETASVTAKNTESAR